MVNVLVAALRNEGIVIDKSIFKGIRFNRMSMNADGIVSRYWVVLYNKPEDDYSVTEVTLNITNLKADIAALSKFDGNYDESMKFFYEL